MYSAGYLQYIKTVLRRLNELYSGFDYSQIKKPPIVSPPSQFTGLLELYTNFCKNMGNKENTTKKKTKFCHDFLCHIAKVGCRNIGEINSKYICKAIVKIGNKDSYAVIRSFLGYLFENGTLHNDFSCIIPKYRRPIPLPTTYTHDEIIRLENTVDRTTRTGKRNYAIILLASRLGMRSGDIAGITFDNIDFEHCSITLIQSKTGQPLSLPLLPEIREALQDYMWYARPNAKNNYLFIQAKAPFEKITTSIIRYALTKVFNSAGIDISSKKHGPHTLRSSMASSMVNSDIPYNIVRKVLGHTDPQSIKRYAKVDIENLRLHAIDVPAPSGTFAAFLQGRV